MIEPELPTPDETDVFERKLAKANTFFKKHKFHEPEPVDHKTLTRLRMPPLGLRPTTFNVLHQEETMIRAVFSRDRLGREAHISVLHHAARSTWVVDGEELLLVDEVAAHRSVGSTALERLVEEQFEAQATQANFNHRRRIYPGSIPALGLAGLQGTFGTLDMSEPRGQQPTRIYLPGDSPAPRILPFE